MEGTRVPALKILHIVSPADVGGLESVVQALAIGHAADGHDVHVAGVVTPSSPADTFFRAFEDTCVTVHRLQAPARSYLRERRFIAGLLESVRPDVVHTHGHRPDLLDSGLARSRGVATVTTVHGFSRTKGLTTIGIWEKLQRRMFRSFDVVIAVSSALHQELLEAGVPANRLRVVQNGWAGTTPDLDRAAARRSLGLAPTDRALGWVGRFVPVKGPDICLGALSTIKDLSWQGVLIGDGPERGALEASTARLGLDARVRFPGPLPEAHRYFNAFDVFVLSSRSEGIPMVLFEAMAARLPIAATDVGGVSEVVTEDTGWIVPPEDPEALGQALREVLTGRGAASARGDAGYRRLHAHFSRSEWLARHERIYRELIEP